MESPRLDDLAAECLAKAREVLALYQEDHVLDSQGAQEALRDFFRFNLAVASMGLRGIRWNFNGCLLCSEAGGPVSLRRVLISSAEIAKASSGRALGAELCMRHDGELVDGKPSPRLAAAGLVRIRRDPPRPVEAS